MKVLIVDDEPAACRGLRRQLDELPGITCVGACEDRAQAVHAIAQRSPDVVLLDIKLGDATAFEIIEEVGVESMPLVIFVTAYDRHALKAFEVHALDYVLKPVDPVRLREALERAASAITTRRAASLVDRLEALLASQRSVTVSAEPVPQRFAVRDGERTCFLEQTSIDWFESAGNWVRVHSGGRMYTMRSTMNDVARRLPTPSGFVRARRSAVINVRAIASLERFGKGTFLLRLRDGTKVISSRFYLSQLRRLLLD